MVPQQLKEKLELDLPTDQIHERLNMLQYCDLIQKGSSDIDFRGLEDGTLYLVLRKRFEKEIHNSTPDWQKEFNQTVQNFKQKNRSLQGYLSQLSGKVAEALLANDIRTRNRFTPSVYFQGVPQDLNQELVIQEVKTRVFLQRDDGETFEFDIQAEAEEKTFLLIEVKKHKQEIGKLDIEKFHQKVKIFQKIHPDSIPIPGFVALGGFTKEAQVYCKEKGIGTATQISFFNQDWSF